MHTDSVSPISPAKKHGIALVMVLGFMVLVTFLVLAFFSSVTIELASSKSYSDGASVRGLSDSAVSAVMGIIRDATSAGSDVAWSSQPGMLRTYDNTGHALQAYKLYSSDKMTVPAFDPADDVDASWKTKGCLFTDLNMPISETSYDASGAPLPSVLHYPIVDPAAADPVTGVEGFSLTNAPGYDKAKLAAPANNPAPMPVKWIYLLRDGTMTAPDKYDTSTGIASFTTGAIPTRSNPIVGRMAFWTDDETAKVNINTASEGTFWDVPVCNTQPPGGTLGSGYIADPNTVYEQDLVEYQGAQKEFQRYPGHPATTCLSTIFQKSLTALNPSMTRTQLISLLAGVTPRVTVYDVNNNDYSSQGGTRRAGPPALYTESAYGGFKLWPDGDRLYASVDELLFAPPAPAPAAFTKRPEQPMAPSMNVKKVVEQARFFVTAQSRAPELNLFNKPRVAIWPLQVLLARRTYFDKLIAFCASVGVHSGTNTLTPYYFTRQDPESSTADWSARNQAIYKYLQNLTSANVPGFGKNFAAKYAGGERDQILTEIFDYIRCTNLVDYSDPSAPTAAYTPTGYTYDANLVPSPSNQNVVVTKRGQVVPIAPPPGTPGAGTRGIGRIATISELALVVIRTGPRKDGQPYGTASGSPIQDDSKTNLQISLIPQLFCPMAGYSALAHNLRIRFKNISIKVNGVDAFATNPNQSGLYDTGRISNAHGTESKNGGVIGYRALMENGAGENGSKTSDGAPADSLPAYANLTISGSSISSNGTNMTLAAANTMVIQGSVDVQIEAPATVTNASPGQVVQTMHFDYPSTTVPIPNRVFALSASSGVGTGTKPNIVDTSGPTPARGERISSKDFQSYNFFDQNIFFTTRLSTSSSFDVVRSVAPASSSIRGDIRLVAAKSKIVTGDYIQPQAYSDPKSAGVHSLRWGAPSTESSCYYTSGPTGPQTFQSNNSNGAVFGSLMAGFPAQYCKNGGPYTGNYVVAFPFDHIFDMTPPMPEGIVGVKNSMNEAGDWDNGPGVIFDGPLCNKADEGTDRHRNHNNNLDSIEAADPPYLSPWEYEDTSDQYAAFFSPNRMMPSPVMLGSLPTGVIRGLPWQTLLFRPAVDYLPGKATHPGGPAGGKIPDHVLLDLFWMPVVEPYAISEPMATAGKINMNYQIVPFTHIKRDTGLRAVMKSVKITALNPNQPVTPTYYAGASATLINDYKRAGRLNQRANLPRVNGGGVGARVRYGINMDETLKQFETERFNKKQAFLSASEICEIPLVPQDPSVTSAASLAGFWANNVLTGDNSLERPYAHLYSRLTTKSNTYTVHVWVETLTQGIPKSMAASDARWSQWNDQQGQVTAQYRGSTLIERYIDPQDPALAKFDETYNGPTIVDAGGNITKAGALDPFYRFRVLSTKRFDR